MIYLEVDSYACKDTYFHWFWKKVHICLMSELMCPSADVIILLEKLGGAGNYFIQTSNILDVIKKTSNFYL